MKKLFLTLIALLIAVPAFAGGRLMDYTMDNGVTVTGAYAEITALSYAANETSFYKYTFYKDEASFIAGKAPLGEKRYDLTYGEIQGDFAALVTAIRTALYAHSDSVLEVDTDADEVPDASFFAGATNL